MSNNCLQLTGWSGTTLAKSQGFLSDRLIALFVEPHNIGQGIGRTLIEHAKSYARQIGGRFLLIQGDPNATAFYLAAGGMLVGERESLSIPGRYLPEFRISLDDGDAAWQRIARGLDSSGVADGRPGSPASA